MGRLFAVPLPWRTKKHKAISIDYKFGQMCGSTNKGLLIGTNLSDAMENARLWLAAVDTEIAKDPSQWSQVYQDTFQLYFSESPTGGGMTGHIQEVRRVIKATMDGIANPIHIASICRWRGGETSTQGYVKTHMSGRKGRIHVALPQFKGTKDADRIEQACILLHEATHKFADTHDGSYLGKSDFPPTPITKALECADCYTYFVRDVVGGKLEVNSWTG